LSSVNSEMKASVCMTREWDAYKAGVDLAKDIVENLAFKSNVILLFSTIHYQDNGGLQSLLDGVYSIIPEEIPLIGGTVRGFSNNYGCYVRGATALVVSSDKMDIALGIGHNTKRNPKKAAQKSADMLQEKLSKSPYKNGFLLNVIAGAEIPNIPPIGRQKIIEPGAAPKALMKLFSVSQKTLQMGSARDEDVVEEMVSLFPDFSMIGGATLDDGPGFKSYQFHNKNVLKNSLITLGIKTDFNIFVKSTHNMKKTDITFEVTKMSSDRRIIHEINGKPALDELLRLLQWPKEILNEETWLKTTFYFPIGGKCCSNSSDENVPHVIGIILGKSLVLTCKLQGAHASILTIDGKRLFDAVDENFSTIPFKTPEFGIISSCTTRLETLGNKIYHVKDQVQHVLQNQPFIIFYVGGESTYSPENGLDYANMSFNTAIFWEKQ
jgi:hypothetical protein